MSELPASEHITQTVIAEDQRAERTQTRVLPFSTKLLLAWLSVVSLAPAVVYVAESVDSFPPGRVPAAILGSVLFSVGGLLLFEPPRSSSFNQWLAQLRVRFTPSSSSFTNPEP